MVQTLTFPNKLKNLKVLDKPMLPTTCWNSTVGRAWRNCFKKEHFLPLQVLILPLQVHLFFLFFFRNHIHKGATGLVMWKLNWILVMYLLKKKLLINTHTVVSKSRSHSLGWQGANLCTKKPMMISVPWKWYGERSEGKAASAAHVVGCRAPC